MLECMRVGPAGDRRHRAHEGGRYLVCWRTRDAHVPAELRRHAAAGPSLLARVVRHTRPHGVPAGHARVSLHVGVAEAGAHASHHLANSVGRQPTRVDIDGGSFTGGPCDCETRERGLWKHEI